MKIAVPDFITNSYFPAVAAVELGFFKEEGIDMTLEHIFPVNRACEVMRDGGIDFVAGAAHAPLAAFKNWEGAKLLGALAQGMYWMLVVRSDLDAERGDIDAIKGLNIGAAPFVELGLRRMLTEVGIDIEADGVKIAPVPGTGGDISFGVQAARVLAEGKIDGFWANGMGAETAIREGVGKLLVDIRRGDEPTKAFNYTQPALMTTDALIEREPETAAAAVRALVKTQKAIVEDVSLTTKIGEKLFPGRDAAMIADVVARDLPYYAPEITPEFVVGMNDFMTDLGWLDGPVPYEKVVATQFSHLWKG